MKRNKLVKRLSALVFAALLPLGVLGVVHAAPTSNFNQVINAGVLSVDIVDALYAPVATPGVTFPPVTFSGTCQNSAGTFGTATQQIYVNNPDAADNGWTVSLAGSATTAVWDGAASDYDFNDPTGVGCTDGADADAVGGQMTVNAAGGTLAVGGCTSGCTTANITLGTSNAFSQGTVDSITLLTAAAGSDDIGDWTLQNVAVTQTIPANQAAAADYDINMTLSIVSN